MPRADFSGPVLLSSAQARNAVSPVGFDAAAAHRLNRCPPVNVLNWTTWPIGPWGEKILAMTLVPAAGLSTLSCVQPSKKRSPDNGTSVGQEDWIRLALVA